MRRFVDWDALPDALPVMPPPGFSKVEIIAHCQIYGNNGTIHFIF
jgi:hypothetical protein